MDGLPALFVEKLKPSVPRCEYCGAERRFEFQLMPALIPYLTYNDNGKGSMLYFLYFHVPLVARVFVVAHSLPSNRGIMGGG